MLKIVLFDIDHTISDSRWRDPMLPPNATWDEYHSALEQDKPFTNMIELINTLAEAGYSPVGFTVRPEKWRSLTNAWMMRHKVSLTHIFMRASTDYSPAHITKVAMIEENFTEAERKSIVFIVDDREDVCMMLTDAFGISSLQVRHKS